MSRAVLADTGPSYALADPDQFHKRSHRELEIMMTGNSRVLIAFPVLCESRTLVLRRLGCKYAASWLSEILSGGLRMNPEASDYLEASNEFLKYSAHPITLAGALLARPNGS